MSFYRLNTLEAVGYNSWRNGGRYFVLWLFQLLSGGEFVLNLFPLPQILGITIYSLSLSWIIQKFNIRDRLVSVFIILSALTVPFLYQIYMYQYDALTMCIAMGSKLPPVYWNHIIAIPFAVMP